MLDESAVRDPHVVRVAAYNVRVFKDDRRSLVDIVRQIQPDVLLLQEAPRHPGSGHRIATFADQVGMTWSDGRRGRMSTTLLTGLRLDVLSCEHYSHPVGRRDEPRGFAVSRLRLPGHRPFAAVSVHLSLQSAQRGPHAQQILQTLETVDAEAVVLGGDFNETFGHGAWLDLGAQLQEVTGDLLTSPSGTPGKTIDGLMVRGPVTAQLPDLGLDELTLKLATDHRPVYADLDISALAL